MQPYQCQSVIHAFITFRHIHVKKTKKKPSLTKHTVASRNSCEPLFKILEATEKSATPSAEKYDLQLPLLTFLLLFLEKKER